MFIIIQLLKVISGVILLGLFMLRISSCALNDLPEIEDSENVFGMYLNGSRWVPNVFSNSSKMAYYYAPHKTLKIQAIKTFNSGDAIFTYYISNFEGAGKYQASFFMEFKATPYCSDSTRYDPNSRCENYFRLDNTTDSFIEIVEFDSVEYKVSGFFNMVLVNDSGEEVNITEGRFRLDTNHF